jgi:hypothetical protein
MLNPDLLLIHTNKSGLSTEKHMLNPDLTTVNSRSHWLSPG